MSTATTPVKAPAKAAMTVRNLIAALTNLNPDARVDLLAAESCDDAPHVETPLLGVTTSHHADPDAAYVELYAETTSTCCWATPATPDADRARLMEESNAAWRAEDAAQAAAYNAKHAAEVAAVKARLKARIIPVSTAADMSPELATAWEVLDRYGYAHLPLSTTGPHRVALTLTGFRKVGNLHPSLVTDADGHHATPDGSTDCPVFVLRFGSRYYALSTYPDGQTRTLYAADYEPTPTRPRAEQIAAALVDGTYTPERFA